MYDMGPNFVWPEHIGKRLREGTASALTPTFSIYGVRHLYRYN